MWMQSEAENSALPLQEQHRNNIKKIIKDKKLF